MKTHIRIPAFLSALLIFPCQAKEDFSRADKDRLIDPVAASPLGGTGTEWLTGGGFQPDGTLVLAGVSLGPVFGFPGTEVAILGPDTAAPAGQKEWPMQFNKDGSPRNNRDGTQRRDRFGPGHPDATAFVVRLGPDFKTIVSASRLPWKAGSLTAAAVDLEGAIYLAGHGDAALLKTLSQDVQASEAPTLPESKNPPALTTHYLAKLSPDGARVEWIRHYPAPANIAPRLEILASGKVLYKSLAFDTFDGHGKMVSRLADPKGLNPATHDLNPENGEYVFGHEHHWPTGREPWRCPELKIYNPDGSVKMHLYEWPGPLVGSGTNRLVSDSALRNIQYLPDGDLLFSAWSDGGNSVMYRQPYNMFERGWNEKEAGLRLSAAGAGAMSFSYIIKVDSETWSVKHGTLWTSQYKGVESTRINDLFATRDGSVALGGTAYGHLYKTPNAFPDVSEAEWTPGNQTNLTILNPALDGLRFSSTMPGCGDVDLGAEANFRWFGGMVGGREMLVAVTGTKNDPKIPTLNAVQGGFGGGLLDGHFSVFDLSVPK